MKIMLKWIKFRLQKYPGILPVWKSGNYGLLFGPWLRVDVAENSLTLSLRCIITVMRSPDHIWFFFSTDM